MGGKSVPYAPERNAASDAATISESPGRITILFRPVADDRDAGPDDVELLARSSTEGVVSSAKSGVAFATSFASTGDAHGFACRSAGSLLHEMILDSTASSTAELLEVLASLSAKVGPDELVWFRGHASSTFKLLPSLARDPKALEREALLAKRFKQNAFPFRQTRPQDEWEWLFLMQHFGVPTRLLDWTESPLVALYFSVNDANADFDAHDGQLWALLPARFNYEVPRLRPAVPVDIPSFGVDTALDDYRPDTIALEAMTNKLPVAAIAHRQNERIMAQLGVFTIMHRDTTPLEELADNFLARITIPAKAKSRVRSELLSLRITRLTLFPELTSVAAVAKELLK